MRILHYALGFSPYRTGGLTKYVMDIMAEQIRQGDDVALLWPGEYSVFRLESFIKKSIERHKIVSFEIRNPLPVSLMDGVKRPELFCKKTKEKVYADLLMSYCPDVIHVHTLMGIHYEFFVACKKLNIPVLFTAHDYYPLCPKVVLYHNHVCHGVCEDCVSCNKNALPMWKIFFLQSKGYQIIKNVSIIKRIRATHKRRIQQSDNQSLQNTTNKQSNVKKFKQYEELNLYYKKCLELVDKIHYVSKLEEQIYKKSGVLGEAVCFPPVNNGITDNRKKILMNEKKKVSFAFLADAVHYKGYYLLLEILDEIWREGYHNFELHVFTSTKTEREYMIWNPPYSQVELSKVLQGIHMVLLPALWQETFGLVVLESISFGIPVLITENTGAKDIIFEQKKQIGMVVEPTKEKIKNELISVLKNPGIIAELNKNICEMNFYYTIEEHYKKLRQVYLSMERK